MDVLQFVATVLVSAIAPLFLFLQQRQQNKREVRLRELDTTATTEAATREAEVKTLADRRKAYAEALRAVGRYNASAAPIMAYVELWAKDPQHEADSTIEVFGIEDPPPFPVSDFASAHEAVAVLRIYAGNDQWIRTLEDSLRASAAAALPSGTMTCKEAWHLWHSLTEAMDQFAFLAEVTLS